MGTTSHCFAAPVALTVRSAQPASCARRRPAPVCSVSRVSVAKKAYQLEELEDQSSCLSAVYLKADGTAALGVTDGPVPDRVEAKWMFAEDDGTLTLEIARWFGADAVPFCVSRVLRGHVDSGANLPLFHGAVFQAPTDFDAAAALGHFAMIAADGELEGAGE